METRTEEEELYTHPVKYGVVELIHSTETEHHVRETSRQEADN